MTHDYQARHRNNAAVSLLSTCSKEKIIWPMYASINAGGGYEWQSTPSTGGVRGEIPVLTSTSGRDQHQLS